MKATQLWLVVALVSFVVAPADADWLVLKEGQRIETSGPWKLRGNLIVFTNAEEVLSSLRARNVDLKASELATAKALLAPAEGPSGEVPQRAIAQLVITDSDVGHVGAEEVSAEGTAKETANGSMKIAPTVILYSTSWCPYCHKARQVLTSQGVTFVEKDIEKDAAAHREYVAKGNGYDGIPLIQIGDRMLRGFNEENILGALKKLTETSSKKSAN